MVRQSRARPGSTTAGDTSMDFKVADLTLADFGRTEITLAEHEMPGLMAMRERYGDSQAARRRPDRRLAAHDDPDRRAHRDAGRARRRGPLGLLQHLLHPGPRRRGRRGRPDGTADDPQGVPVFAWKGETLEEYWWCTQQILAGPGRPVRQHDPRRRRRRHPARPPRRRGREGAARPPTRRPPTAHEQQVVFDVLNALARRERRPLDHGSPTRSRASPRRPPPACTASTT